MKKDQSSRIVKFFGSVFKIRYWLDFDRIKTFTLFLGHGIKNLFIPKRKTRGESFEAAIKTLKLDATTLAIRKKALYRLSIFMLLIFFSILIYSIYHLFYAAYGAAFLSFVIALIALVLAFRYHFWYFQIQQQKLGCSLREWFTIGLLGKKQ